MRKWLLVVALLSFACGAPLNSDSDDPAEPVQLTEQTAAQCENGANGFIDISDSLVGTRVKPILDLGSGVSVTLESGTVAGAQRGWARIHGSTIAGDQVWMDWTTNNGSSWLQCGPFTVGFSGMSKTSAAKKTSSSTSYRFRACGRLVGSSSKCIIWW